MRVVVDLEDYDLVEWLLHDVKVDVNEMCMDKRMRTALYGALRNKNQQIVHLLLKNGANIAQTMYSYKTGISDHFICAMKHTSPQILNILLTYGAAISGPISSKKYKFALEKIKIIEKH